jgi:hypothetical protein
VPLDLCIPFFYLKGGYGSTKTGWSALLWFCCGPFRLVQNYQGSRNSLKKVFEKIGRYWRGNRSGITLSARGTAAGIPKIPVFCACGSSPDRWAYSHESRTGMQKGMQKGEGGKSRSRCEEGRAGILHTGYRFPDKKHSGPAYPISNGNFQYIIIAESLRTH